MDNAFTIKKVGSRFIFTRNSDNRVAEFDIATNEFYSHHLNGRIAKVKNLQRFFQGYMTKDIIDCFENDKKFGEFLMYVDRLEKNCYSISTFLSRAHKYSHLEQYLKAGFKIGTLEMWATGDEVRLSSLPELPMSNHNSGSLRTLKKHDIRITKGLERIINDSDFIRYLNIIDLYFEDEFIEFYKIITSQYNFNKFKELIDEYSYDPKSLFEYLIYIRDYEAMYFTYILNNLRDYASMQSKMSKSSFEKYPRYLATTHDIVTRNYNLFRVQHSEELFKLAIDKYRNLCYNNSMVIKVPEVPQDIRDEGVSLSHCVGSYIDRVISGNSKILFLRNRDSIDKSLVTIEVQDSRVVQCRGKCNRSVTAEENEFIKKWAKSKGLEY